MVAQLSSTHMTILLVSECKNWINVLEPKQNTQYAKRARQRLYTAECHHVSGAMQLRCCDLLPRRVGAVRRRSASTHGTGRLEQLGSTSWGMMFASSCSECLHVHGMLFWKLNLRRGRIGQMESVSGGGQRCNAHNRRFAGGNCGTRTHGLPLAAINLGAQPT